MGFFVLHSEITIGSRVLSGVHEVVVRRGMRGYNDTATIALPDTGVRRFAKRRADGTLEQLDVAPDRVTTGTLFSVGDAVTIKLGYNGDLREEFRGFVSRLGLQSPVTVECEGYVRKLRLNTDIKYSAKGSIGVKKLLELACAGTGIKVECPVDFKLKGIKKIGNGMDVLDHIMRCTDKAVSIFFKKPDVLWCGLVYTPYQAGKKLFSYPAVQYRIGFNCLRDNGLKERVVKDPVQYIINGKTVTGDSVRTESKDNTAAQKVRRLLNNVADEAFLKDFAQERQLQANYEGAEGHINGLLQPFCLPGYDLELTDTRYPKRNGTYLVEAIEVTFGVRGAYRRVYVGPKLVNG